VFFEVFAALDAKMRGILVFKIAIVTFFHDFLSIAFPFSGIKNRFYYTTKKGVCQYFYKNLFQKSDGYRRLRNKAFGQKKKAIGKDRFRAEKRERIIPPD
jgi:hypothetical protein